MTPRISSEALIIAVVFLLVQLALCQMNYEGTTGLIYSPNYPENYGNNENDVYTVTVPVGHYIHLTMLDFLTEDPYDFLEILEGIGADAVPVQKLSGDKTGTVIDTTASEITLIFKTDLTTTFRGFAIRYDMVQFGTVFMPTNSCPSPVHSSSFGIVTSPSFPANYPNNISCSYLLIAPTTHVISLQFVAFNTEAGYDVVYIYDGSNNSYPLIGKFSGTKIPAAITSTSNSLYIFFSSDLVNNFPGFSGLYTSSSTGTDSRKGVLPQVILSNATSTTITPRRDANILKWLQDKKNALLKKTTATTTTASK